MKEKNKTLKEKVERFVFLQKESRKEPAGDSFLGYAYDEVLQAFTNNYDETVELVKTANTEELECFIWVLEDFIQVYPKEEIIQLCIERKKAVGEFETCDFEDEIEIAKETLVTILKDK